MSDCSICLSPLEEGKKVQLDCGHTFHLDCICKWNKNSCPNCRAKIQIGNLCTGNHQTTFYVSYYKKNGICRICDKKSFKSYMLDKVIN